MFCTEKISIRRIQNLHFSYVRQEIDGPKYWRIVPIDKTKLA